MNLTQIAPEIAEAIDATWKAAGYPDDGLRIYGCRVAGNATVTYLGVPGTDNAPLYVYNSRTRLFDHVDGPTAFEWPWPVVSVNPDYMEQRQASRDADDLYAWATGR